MISKTAFQQLITALRKKIKTDFPYLKSPVPHEKSGIIRGIYFLTDYKMKAHVTNEISLSVTENNFFKFQCNRFIEIDILVTLEEAVIQIFRERNVHGFMNKANRDGTRQLIALSPKLEELYSWLTPHSEVRFEKDRLIFNLRKYPTCMISFHTGKRPFITFKPSDYSNLTFAFYSKHEVEAFIAHTREDVSTLLLREKEVRTFALSFSGCVTENKFSVRINLFDETVSFGISYMFDHKHNAIHCYGYFNSFEKEGTLDEVAQSLVHYIEKVVKENRVRQLFKEKKTSC